ncbi:RICIN domain-containing protein [Streptomyces nogalater]|uniref:RICIN domain-containing protein n=1 Tax=Streptomyces nogalater TaxID=38314 RepID=A0ABW0WJ54_STRNO
MNQRVKVLRAVLLSLATTGALLSASAAGTAAADGPGNTGTGTRVTKAVSRAADPVQTFRNVATNKCLDDSSAGVRTFDCNNLDFQKWEVHVFQDGTRRLRNIATGQCLASGGGRLTMGGCNSSREVSWWVRKGGGNVVFQNQAAGTCLDDSNAGLRLFACNSLDFQNWR